MSDYPEVDAFLEHHGVKGMHWGVRKEQGGSAAPSKSRQIKDARKRVAAAGEKYDEQQLKYFQATTEDGRQHALNMMGSIATKNSQDAELANHMTTGEKVTSALILGGAGAIYVASIVATSRH